jgi:Cys-rich protein (TIGR01571 family)
MLSTCNTSTQQQTTPPIVITQHSGKIREKYNISGSFLGDVLAVWCCGCCAVSQQSRELKHKGVSKYSCF